MPIETIPDPLSPLDGRYALETAPLRSFFSEFAFLRDRVRVELDYVRALSRNTPLIRSLTDSEASFLDSIITEFGESDAREIKEYESQTRHDVKAIEYYVRARLASSALADILEWLHFGLTSEDVNQIAQAVALRDSRDQVLVPALRQVVDTVAALASHYRGTVMLARTHGQAAVPTTLGKEFAVFLSRLKTLLRLASSHVFDAKLNGAVGNMNALVAAAPGVDWITFSEDFVTQYGLSFNPLTTQLLPFDNWVRYFDTLRLINSVLIDLAQDMWRYVSDDYLRSKVIPGEVGSSTMPQKVNPIHFENAEGNLGIANALFSHYGLKLPISRLQRDLSDSTVRRTFGVALGHSLVAYINLVKGLGRIEANPTWLEDSLESHWEVIMEGVQTILRAASVPNAYDLVKSFARGRPMTRNEYEHWVETLQVPEVIKRRLEQLTPVTYIGLAEQLVDRALEQS